jgi:hypothetical protein
MTEVSGMRLKPDVLRRVRSAHPMGEPVVEFANGFLCARRVSVGLEDRILLSIGDIARAVGVRHAREGGVHFTRRESGIGHGADATGFVDFDLRTVLRRGHADEKNQREPSHAFPSRLGVYPLAQPNENPNFQGFKQNVLLVQELPNQSPSNRGWMSRQNGDLS